MNDIFEVSFDIEAEDRDKWKKVFDSLDSNGCYKFQNTMSSFGKEVDEYLEGVLEDGSVGPEAFNLIGWRLKDGCLEAEFEFFDIDFADVLHTLFSLCPVKNIKVVADWE